MLIFTIDEEDDRWSRIRHWRTSQWDKLNPDPSVIWKTVALTTLLKCDGTWTRHLSRVSRGGFPSATREKLTTELVEM